MKDTGKNTKTNFFAKAGQAIGKFFQWLRGDLKEIGTTFVEGDWKTKVSFLIMGFGNFARKQFVRGIAFLATEILFILYMVKVGFKYLPDLGTLGTVESGYDENFLYVYGDNSFFILLFSILSIFAILGFILVWRINVKNNRQTELLLKQGKRIPTNRQDLASLFDKHFDKTLLALPMLGIGVFVVLPIVFMICIAFTNYDYSHLSPGKLFTWVGFENFRNLVSVGEGGFGTTFVTVLLWTLVWAFFATFLNYFLGMGVAILINKKGIKFKKVWRTILIMTIAIPQIVSLLYVGKLFAADGLVNLTLMKYHLISAPLPFWTNEHWARVMIILINIWIGIPYAMLMTTGLLMNIPEELYESARIDGANPFQMFRHITLPYMLFVTGPYLLTNYIANLNNFNVIYLLSQGSPRGMKLAGGAGYTDLLITWLYKMTVNNSDYKMAAVIGIMVFAVTAIISLVVYSILPSVKDEEGFQ